MGRPALSESQKKEIFDGFARLETSAERRAYEAQAAQQYGVSSSTIYRVTHDPERAKQDLERFHYVHDMAMGKIMEGQMDAVKTQLDLMRNDKLPMNLWYLRQNAAKDIMNRAGLKDRGETQDGDVQITFGAVKSGDLPCGMPPADDEEA